MRSIFLLRLITLSLVFMVPASNGYAEEILLTKLSSPAKSFRKPSGVLISKPNTSELEIIHLLRSNQIRTLDDYAAWLEKNIRYEKDSSRDSWARPHKTLQLKKGDCEDYTLLNMAVLKALGFDPKFLTLKKGKTSHAVCAFKKNGQFYWFNNGQLLETPARSLSELAKHISNLHHYSHILSWDNVLKSWKSLYKNS